MRCILGLATAGLVILSGTAAADAQPARYEPDPSAAQSTVDPPPWPPRPVPLPYPLPPRPNPEPPVPNPSWIRPTPPRPVPFPPRPIPLPPRPQPLPPRPPVTVPPWGPTIDGPYPKRLTLSVSRMGRTRTVRLACTPTYGTHPRGPEACALLSRVQGNPAYVRLPWMACPRHYDPVTASVTGTWNGRYVHYRRTFSNQCELRAATGAIFSF
ncbi:SSI family serine proteinase inhibitor [Streptosporangium sp. NPDC023825]|uniref:SSI family serine proteinase inhibitor n=1 Tax=Streptosporangium sp. NPDC023825 TaxID=3154909 RepID=UPI00341C6A36